MGALETVVLQETAALAGGDLFADPWRTSLFKPPLGANPPLLDTVYLIQLAVWIMTAICHIWAFEPQSDYFIMLAHHIVTIGLVCISYQNGFVRFGLMVLWIHDISDIPIDMLKLTNYLRLEQTQGFFLVEISFLSTLASWAYLRLWVYPVQVIYHAAAYAVCNILVVGNVITSMNDAYCPTEGFTPDQLQQTMDAWTWLGSQYHGEQHPYPVMRFWAFCTCILLSVLLVMHVWWYFLFLRILKGIIFTGSTHEAGRQQYEGDDEKDAATLKTE
jgi:ceramide synthetase